jgi:hypothetical protein
MRLKRRLLWNLTRAHRSLTPVTAQRYPHDVHRLLQQRTVVFAVALVAALVIDACGGGSDQKSSSAARRPTQSTPVPGVILQRPAVASLLPCPIPNGGRGNCEVLLPTRPLRSK